MPTKPKSAGICLNVPAHSQDCTGYCGPGCVTMIFDAFDVFSSAGFSQVDAYTEVYKDPAGEGPFDRWHTSPEQLELMLRKKLNYRRTERELPTPADIDGLLTTVRAGLDKKYPAIMLLAYDDAAAVPHAAGTHWVVVRGYTVRDKKPSGYFTLDPWRRWKNGVADKADPGYKHAKSPPAPPPPAAGAALLAAPTTPAPEIVASWHRNPSEVPGEAQPLTVGGKDMAAAFFRGIRTDSRAYILTVPPGEPFNVQGSDGALPGDAVAVPVPDSWPQWLSDVLAGDGARVPVEFERALPDWSKPKALPVSRTDSAGRGYKLLVWPVQPIQQPQQFGLQLVAWVTGDPFSLTGPSVEGVAAVRDWPAIKSPGDPIPGTGLSFPLSEDQDWPERTALMNRIKLRFVTLPAPTVSRLIWEPCPLSLSPALPVYEVILDLPAAAPLPAKTVRVLVTPDGCVFLKAARGSKAGG